MTVPALERSAEALSEDAAERNYWEKHGQELIAKYPDLFVAVRRDEVVAAAKTLLDLAEELKAKRIEPSRTWVRFLTTKPEDIFV